MQKALVPYTLEPLRSHLNIRKSAGEATGALNAETSYSTSISSGYLSSLLHFLVCDRMPGRA